MAIELSLQDSLKSPTEDDNKLLLKHVNTDKANVHFMKYILCQDSTRFDLKGCKQ